MTTTERILRLFGLTVLLGVAGLASAILPGSTGTTFAMGGLDLRIDNKTSYNGVLVPTSTWALKNLVPRKDRFFKFKDVKPGDHGESTVSLHILRGGPAWACLAFFNLRDRENGINEPESHEDLNGSLNGELAEGLEFFSWYDDGDNIFEIGEKPIFGTSTQAAGVVLKNKVYTLADSQTGSPLQTGITKYIGITWCAGDLQVDVPNSTITCNGDALGNEAQTDSLSVDIGFFAVPTKNNSKFLCNPKRKPGEHHQFLPELDDEQEVHNDDHEDSD